MYVNNYSVQYIRNIDSEPLEVKYDGMVHAVMEPGETLAFPQDLAEHAFDTLATRILLRQGKNIFSDAEKAKLRDQILVSSHNKTAAEPQTKGEKLKAEVDALNATRFSPPLPPTEPVYPTEVETNTPPVETYVTPEPPVQLEPEEEVVPEVYAGEEPDAFVEDNTPPEVPAETAPISTSVDEVKERMETAQKMPTRQAVYDYARDSLGMVLDDPKTFTYLESLSVRELVAEIGYPVGE